MFFLCFSLFWGGIEVYGGRSFRTRCPIVVRSGPRTPLFIGFRFIPVKGPPRLANGGCCVPDLTPSSVMYPLPQERIAGAARSKKKQKKKRSGKAPVSSNRSAGGIRFCWRTGGVSVSHRSYSLGCRYSFLLLLLLFFIVNDFKILRHNRHGIVCRRGKHGHFPGGRVESEWRCPGPVQRLKVDGGVNRLGGRRSGVGRAFSGPG